jgi:hypothetical protein
MKKVMISSILVSHNQLLKQETSQAKTRKNQEGTLQEEEARLRKY